MPEPLGKDVVTTTTMDANLNHCLATGKSLPGRLHFVNKTPVDWYSKKQATAETDRILTYGTLLDVLWQMYHAWITYGTVRGIA